MHTELIWDDAPHVGNVCFSRDLYDKYSLAPNIKELWTISQSSTVKDDMNKEKTSDNLNHECPPVTEVDNSNTNTDRSDTYPEPRLPFPRLSSLTIREQMLYLQILMQKKNNDVHQGLQERVKNEISVFMKYLQDVAKACAEDYDYLPEGAVRYTEEYLTASLEKVKLYPQVYLIHEMTSITGGRFNPDLSLNFEKLLLALGKVNIADLKILPKDIQLAVDYETVSSVNPPDKKASLAHSDISCDANAEKLCARYEPHVCLGSEALLRLLNNHGPEYCEAWELPVWIKVTSGNGSCFRKTVYIDSPLVTTEISVREKSLLFHEESLNLSLKKACTKKVFELQLDDPAADHMVPWTDKCPRSLVSFDDPGIDFEMDFTNLETFGESACASKQPESRRQPKASPDGVKPVFSQSQAVPLSPRVASDTREVEYAPLVKQADSSWTDVEDISTLNYSETGNAEASDSSLSGKAESGVSSPAQGAGGVPAKRSKTDASDEELLPVGSDSDEERLVIDQGTSSATDSCVVKNVRTSPVPPTPEKVTPAPRPVADTPRSPSPKCIPDTPGSPTPEPNRPDPGSPAGRGATPVARKSASKKCDQLGKILRMQSVLLKPSPQQGQEPMPLPPPAAHSHPQSLVKPCVSSYLGASQSPAHGVSSTTTHTPADGLAAVQQKRLLSEDLLVSAEDELDYAPPDKGNLLYKLYSLQDVLLMVRSNVPLARCKKAGGSPRRTVPAFFLPKLEYQLCYGVECLTKSEVCSLWAQGLLHSSTVFYVGHINAHTSKLFLMEEFTPDRIREAPCDFNPAKSLNILHHLLKKVIGLQEGRYLLSHKAGDPFVTIAKATDGKKISRATYDLHLAHSSLPQAPAHGMVPWVPVDPTHVLSFHMKHGRVPCTFPPWDKMKNQQGKAAQGQWGAGAAQSGANQNPAKKKRKKNKGKRPNRLLAWQLRKMRQQGGQNRGQSTKP